MEKQAQLFASIFHGASLDGAAAKLETIVNKYPYFSIAQFYLLSQLPIGSASRQKQARKTALLFNNAYWLNFQLQNLAITGTSDNAALAPAPPVLATNDESNKATVAVAEPAIEEPVIPAVDNSNITDTLAEDNDSTTGSSESEPLAVSINTTIDEPSTASAIEPIAEDGDIAMEDEAANNTGTNDAVVAIENIQEIAATALTAAEPAAMEEANKLDEALPLIAVAEADLNQEADPGTITPISNEPQANEMTIPAPKTYPDVSNTDETTSLLFEPLHTTDYFASLGIKISDEVKPSDKLGKQLKSFTEWLKTMKKIHGAQVESAANTADTSNQTNEAAIQQLAEHSNKEEAVVTEAMADVLIQQGRNKKAVAVLEKLSLLNPGKSAYFAAKINQIKEL